MTAPLCLARIDEAPVLFSARACQMTYRVVSDKSWVAGDSAHNDSASAALLNVIGCDTKTHSPPHPDAICRRPVFDAARGGIVVGKSESGIRSEFKFGSSSPVRHRCDGSTWESMSLVRGIPSSHKP